MGEKERLFFDFQMTQHQLSEFQRREGGGCQGGVGGYADSLSQTTNGTHEELAALHKRQENFHSHDAATVFTIRDEYANERLQPGASVEYLPPSVVHARHLVHVVSGKLTDASGEPLNPQGLLSRDGSPPAIEGGGVDGQTEDETTSSMAMYVLTQQGELLVSFEHGRHRHSSLVAGAPVCAAGCLRVRNGRLLEFDNHSGHYHPSAASLQVVATWLRSKGVDLEGVRIIASLNDSIGDGGDGDDGGDDGGYAPAKANMQPVRGVSDDMGEPRGLISSPVLRAARVQPRERADGLGTGMV